MLVQLYLSVTGRAVGLGETLIRFFSYFTILTNWLVIIYATAAAFASAKSRSTWVMSPSLETAITLYIVVVGVVYNLVLRQLYLQLHGAARLANEIQHVAVPAAMLGYWLICTPRTVLPWRDIPAWLLYPAIYAIIVMIRGSFSGFYPYPFLDAGKLGYYKVLLNSGAMVLLFLVLALIAVGLTRREGRLAKGASNDR